MSPRTPRPDDQRDDDLGAALSGLPVPDHGPTFWADLNAELSDATATSIPTRARGETTVPHPTESATGVGPEPTTATSEAAPVSLSERRARRASRTGRSEPVHRRSRSGGRPRRGRGRRRHRDPPGRPPQPGPGRRAPGHHRRARRHPDRPDRRSWPQPSSPPPTKASKARCALPQPRPAASGGSPWPGTAASGGRPPMAATTWPSTPRTGSAATSRS